MGGLLRTIRDPDAWEKICKRKIWDLPEDQCGMVPALRLSCHHLPPHLKRRFAYCSIVLKGYKFPEELIILLWRAEGLLQQKAKGEIKDFGNQCSRDLVSRSFIQKSSNGISLFEMHDLTNDLAQLVAGEICSKLKGDKQQKISHQTRHLSYVGSYYDTVEKFEALYQMKSFRTFLPLQMQRRCESSGCYLTTVVLHDLLPRLKCLRVFSLNGYEIAELPDIFENLKHLRLLSFSCTAIKYLPNSQCTLYHLETLILRQCRQLEKFTFGNT
ncbi:hypothetical protein PTKIN_Ptkin14bG0075700 [Pterospermum kingtungense]